MLVNTISKLSRKTCILFPQLIFSHTSTCPTNERPKNPCYDTSKSSGSDGPKGSLPTMKRPMYGAKVRLGLIPDDWFLFFHSKTGVCGPYIFGLVLTNYLLSKEKYILEHEYYIGLSLFVMIYYISTQYGQDIGKSLDKMVDEHCASWEKSRVDEILFWENNIKLSKDANWRAEGQKLLMDAKKENIAMQIEAVYRERLMHVYKSVKGRLDYQVKLHQAEARIHQKWMLGWILENVWKSITPEFEQRVLQRAIEDIGAIAGRAGK